MFDSLFTRTRNVAAAACNKVVSVCSSVCSVAKSTAKAWIIGGSVAIGALATQPVQAGATPTMTDIDFPIDPASIGTAVAAAGALVLLIVFGYKVGFGLVKKVLTRVHGAI